MEPIILIGGGGHCVSCIDVLILEKKYDIIGILDITDKVGSYITGIQIIGTDNDIPYLTSKYTNFLITIGQIKNCNNRIRIFNAVKGAGGNLPVIISPEAFVSSTADIGEGSIIMHKAVINAHARIGKNCIINTGALIEHEAIVGDFCHISTQAVLNGQVKIGDRSFVGSNAVIANNLLLPEGIIIGAGAALLRSPMEPGVFIGNPARRYSEK